MRSSNTKCPRPPGRGHGAESRMSRGRALQLRDNVLVAASSRPAQMWLPVFADPWLREPGVESQASRVTASPPRHDEARTQEYMPEETSVSLCSGSPVREPGAESSMRFQTGSVHG